MLSFLDKDFMRKFITLSVIILCLPLGSSFLYGQVLLKTQITPVEISQEASFEIQKPIVGQEVYFPNFELNEKTGAYVINNFEKKDIGAVMNVTPHINSQDEILVEVRPEVSRQGPNVVYAPTLSAPAFNKTEASTPVLTKDGETIAIGGLLTDLRTSTYTRVPILGDLPWIDNVFRSKRKVVDAKNNRKSETFFFVTLGIVETERQPTRETLHPLAGTISNLEY